MFISKYIKRLGLSKITNS